MAQGRPTKITSTCKLPMRPGRSTEIIAMILSLSLSLDSDQQMVNKEPFLSLQVAHPRTVVAEDGGTLRTVPAPSTLVPHPSSLNPTPSSLFPHPCTLHPQIVNLKLYTLNRKPRCCRWPTASRMAPPPPAPPTPLSCGAPTAQAARTDRALRGMARLGPTPTAGRVHAPQPPPFWEAKLVKGPVSEWGRWGRRGAW